MLGRGEGAPPRVLELDPRSIASLCVAVAGLVVVTGLVRSVPRSLAMVAIASVVALGLDPLVSSISARVRLSRAASLALLLCGLALAVVAVGAALVPRAVSEARDIPDDIPEVVAELGDLPVIGGALVEADVPDRVERFIDELPERLSGEDTPLLDVGRSLADTLVAGLATFLLVVTLLLDGPRLVGRVQRLIPEQHRDRAGRLGALTYRVVGRYVAGSLFVALVAGFVTLVAGLVLGVPLAPLLAVWIMVWDLVPQVGGAAGGIPFVLLAFTQGPLTGVAAGVFFVVYLQIENNVLQPLLVGQAVKLSPPATMVGALVGVSAGGVVGALLAVPMLGAAKAVYLELRPPPSEAGFGVNNERIP